VEKIYQQNLLVFTATMTYIKITAIDVKKEVF